MDTALGGFFASIKNFGESTVLMLDTEQQFTCRAIPDLCDAIFCLIGFSVAFRWLLAPDRSDRYEQP